MDPPSPSKLGMSPPWKPFAVSPDRAGGIIPPYGEPVPQSPSAPVLSSIPPLSPTRSPIRSPMHKRTDSDVSVQGLATMFESLEVKDPREVAQRYKQMLDKEKAKWTDKINRQDRNHAMVLERKAVRIEELESELAQAKACLQNGVSREQYEKDWKANKANVKKWEQIFKEREDQWRSDNIKARTLEEQNKVLEAKCAHYQKNARAWQKENLIATNMVPTMQAKVNGLKTELQRAQSDIKHKTSQAENFQNQVYSLQVELEGAEARLGEEIQTLKDTLRTTESERDALKTSLKEEEVLRIAAEGSIPLPTATADESDEFGSPVRSPRKQRNMRREDDDKENVAPKKTAVELKIIQQELASERRLRQRAQDQIDFMKMECQFQCCSCRIAENKGKSYVHDDTYTAQMQRIIMSVPALTPPPSNHGDDIMEGVVIKQEPVENEDPLQSPSEETPVAEQNTTCSTPAHDSTMLVHNQPEAVVAFSPSTGTFRAVSSPVKAQASTHISAPARSSDFGLSASTEMAAESSPWTPDAHSTMIPKDIELDTLSRRSIHKENAGALIHIHEDAVEDEDEDEEDEDGDDMEPQTPLHGPSEPATPARYELHTTTTTIPIAFSPATPAFRPGKGPMTPSTVAHGASDARTPVLGELSLNKLPFDREAALEAIRQRRGRARSMAAGHGTPMKQMVEGVKDRRDISAPVSRARR